LVAFILHGIEEGLLFAILALGVYISFRVLDFPDLTVDGSYPLGAAVAAIMIFKGSNPFLVLPLSILAGALAGLLTGILHTKLKIAPLLAGILTMICLYSINLRIMGRPNISLSPYLGHKTVISILKGVNLPLKNIYFIPLIFLLVVIALKLLLDLFLHTELGLAIRTTGDNEQMGRANGINTDTTKIIGLSLSNGMVALSGALFAQYQGFADVGMGIGMIIAGLASVIIGEALIRGKTLGIITFEVVIGAIAYRLAIAAALKWGYNLGFKPTDLKLLTGLLVILILSFPILKTKIKLKSFDGDFLKKPEISDFPDKSPNYTD